MCVLSPVLPVTLAYFAVYFAMFHRVSPGVYAAMVAVGAVLLLIAIWQRWRLGANELVDPEPLLEPVEQVPALVDELKKVAAQLGVPMQSHVRLTLGPPASTPPGEVLKQAVRGEHNEVVLPVGCLTLWSVFDLRCHLARSLARPRGRTWLMRWTYQMIRHLGAEHYQMVGQDQMMDHSTNRFLEARRPRWIEQLLERYNGEIARWQLLADCDADRRAAQAYGAELVVGWMQKTWQAEIAMPWYRAAFIEPAAQQAKLFPVAEGYLSFHHQMEPSWSQAERDDTADHEEPVTPMQIRIEALRHADGAAAVFDTRPAASLFTDLEALEAKVVRKELDLPQSLKFRRLEVAEYAESVVIPLMREDLERNRHLLGTKSVDDIPMLVARSRELAESFAPRPLLLLDAAQKRVMIPDLLSSFLVVQLLDRGWTANFSFWEGFRLSAGGVEVDPGRVVRELGNGALSGEEFHALIATGQAACG